MIIFKFTLLDWLVLAILAYSVVISWYKGYVREILAVVTVLVGLLLAAWFHGALGGLFKDVARTENLALFFGFSLIFLVTLLVGFVILHLLTRFKKFAELEWSDRLLGTAFGFIRGWLIGVVLLLALTAFEVQTQRLQDSELVQYFLPGSRVIALMTPYDLKAKFLVGYRGMERRWRQP
jgi:membrane protein required for colicin V production